MPIYEYRCNQCSHVSEILTAPGSGESLPLCKNCGSSDLEKLMSAPSILLRDSGHVPGTTCCGREERCDTPPCSTGDGCRRG